MEVKMTMEEYKELEKAKEKYEVLQNEIKKCTKIFQDKSKDPDSYIDIIAEIDANKLKRVLLENINFSKSTDIDRIEFRNIKK